MDKVLKCILKGVQDNIDYVINELLDSHKYNYDFEKIRRRVYNLLVDVNERFELYDIDIEKVKDIAKRINSNVEESTIKITDFNNVLMEVRYSYRVKDKDFEYTSTISAFDYPDIINKSL